MSLVVLLSGGYSIFLCIWVYYCQVVTQSSCVFGCIIVRWLLNLLVSLGVLLSGGNSIFLCLWLYDCQVVTPSSCVFGCISCTSCNIVLSNISLGVGWFPLGIVLVGGDWAVSLQRHSRQPS